LIRRDRPNQGQRKEGRRREEGGRKEGRRRSNPTKPNPLSLTKPEKIRKEEERRRGRK
jgi:hypothetical protein